jgi:hypothetical protein
MTMKKILLACVIVGLFSGLGGLTYTSWSADVAQRQGQRLVAVNLPETVEQELQSLGFTVSGPIKSSRVAAQVKYVIAPTSLETFDVPEMLRAKYPELIFDTDEVKWLY